MKAFLIYGPSGSGKSSRATDFIFDPCNNQPLWIERDIIRFQVLRLGSWKEYKINQTTENIVDAWWKYNIIRASIENSNIIISDTLCKPADRDKLERLLLHLGYSVEWIRMNTSLEECILRDSKRGNMSVGEKVIRSQWDHFVKGGWDDTTSDRLDKIFG